MLSIPPPSDAAIKTILSSILTGFLAEFSPDLRSMAGPLVNASTAAYNRCACRPVLHLYLGAVLLNITLLLAACAFLIQFVKSFTALALLHV
jgi:hypothetical protein